MARTNIDIDDDLVERAMRLTGARTKREVVHVALRHLVKSGGLHGGLRRIRGRLDGQGVKENPNRVDIEDIARLSGVAPSTVRKWRQRIRSFPKPVDMVNGRYQWSWHKVRLWIRRRKTLLKARVPGSKGRC